MSFDVSYIVKIIDQVGKPSKDIIKAVRQMRIEFSRLGKAMSKVKSGAVLLPRDMKTLSRAAGNLGAQTKKSKKELENLKGILSQIPPAANPAAYSLKKIEGPLAKIANRARSLKNSIASAIPGITKLGNRAKSVGGKISGAGKSMFTKFAIPAIAAGTMMATTAYGFEKSMNALESVTFLTSKNITLDMSKLRKEAKRLGMDTAYSSRQAGDMMTFLAKAGWRTNQILASSANVMDLAAASSTDLATTADIASNIMGAFGIDPANAKATKDALDTLAAVTGTANVDLTMLGETMKYAGPIAKAFGADVKTSGVVAGLLGNIGIQGSSAGTTMKNLFLNLAKGNKVLDFFGIQVQTAKGNMVPFDKIMKQLGDKLVGLGKADKLKVIHALFGRIGMAGATKLIELARTGGLQRYAEQIGNIGDASGKMAKIRLKGIVGDWVRLQSALEGMWLALGEAGVVEILGSIAVKLRDFAIWVSKASPGMKKFIIVLIGLAIVIPPIIIALGMLVFAIGQLMIIPGMIVAFSGLIGVIVGLSFPILVVVGALLILGTAIAAIVYHWDEIKTAFYHIWLMIKDLAGEIKSFADSIPDWALVVISALAPIIGIPLLLIKHWDVVKKHITDFMAWIDVVVKPVIDWLKEPIKLEFKIPEFIKGFEVPLAPGFVGEAEAARVRGETAAPLAAGGESKFSGKLEIDIKGKENVEAVRMVHGVENTGGRFDVGFAMIQ
jgi:TP901 family phage tail tape measure protein